MVQRNNHIAKLISGYLFPEINKRKMAFLQRNPQAKILSLGIGDTTEHLQSFIVNGLKEGATALGTIHGYTGYGLEQGQLKFRELVSKQLYNSKINPDDIFISDGSKCDIGRLQTLFGSQATVAIQDPSYPAYVDTSVILGQTANYNHEKKHYNGITYMTCLPESDFFPDLDLLPRTDLIYFCSPNNPTGAVATKEQLSKLVRFAQKNKSIIIFDAAYAHFIKDSRLPKSIYQIEGAENVAIELGSFSKMAGFTGIRLGWSIVPKTLRFDCGHPIHADWNRINSTFFNGASNIAQAGGIAALQPEGLEEMSRMANYYMENASILLKAFQDLGYTTYGGVHAPYLWVRFPQLTSWEAFEKILEEAHIITTPGSGFGPAGEGFVRFSAFGRRENILEASDRIYKRLQSVCSCH